MGFQPYTPLPFGTYYYQAQKPMYYHTIQRPSYYQSLMQEYKHNPNNSNNSQVSTNGYKKSAPCLIYLPVCPCWCCLQLYYIFLSDPNGVPGEESVTFPEETGPISSGTPKIPGLPYSIGGILGHHGLPFEAQHITRKG